MMTPNQLGPSSAMLRALAACDARALEAISVPSRRGFFARWLPGGPVSAARAARKGWLFDALAPWRERATGRAIRMRSNGIETRTRFAELGGEVAIVVLRREGYDWRFAGVRKIARDDFEDFGELV